MPLTFQKIEPVSKKARIVASLRQAILSGGITSGEQIVEGSWRSSSASGRGSSERL